MKGLWKIQNGHLSAVEHRSQVTSSNKSLPDALDIHAPNLLAWPKDQHIWKTPGWKDCDVLTHQMMSSYTDDLFAYPNFLTMDILALNYIFQYMAWGTFLRAMVS